MPSSSEPSDAAPVEGDDDVVAAVLSANRVFVAVASRALARVRPEVTLPQFRALVLLEAHESMTVAELADALGVVPSTASRMADRLVTRKLIRRSTDAANRRQVQLRLSAAGRRLIEQSTRGRRREITRLLRAIPKPEQERLAASLRLLVDAAGR